MTPFFTTKWDIFTVLEKILTASYRDMHISGLPDQTPVAASTTFTPYSHHDPGFESYSSRYALNFTGFDLHIFDDGNRQIVFKPRFSRERGDHLERRCGMCSPLVTLTYALMLRIKNRTDEEDMTVAGLLCSRSVFFNDAEREKRLTKQGT